MLQKLLPEATGAHSTMLVWKKKIEPLCLTAPDFRHWTFVALGRNLNAGQVCTSEHRRGDTSLLLLALSSCQHSRCVAGRTMPFPTLSICTHLLRHSYPPLCVIKFPLAYSLERMFCVLLVLMWRDQYHFPNSKSLLICKHFCVWRWFRPFLELGIDKVADLCSDTVVRVMKSTCWYRVRQHMKFRMKLNTPKNFGMQWRGSFKCMVKVVPQ